MSRKPLSAASTPSPPTVVWLRRDLRLADHAALHAVASSGAAVLPLFILDEASAARPAGAAALWWLDRSLRALSDDLARLGSRLILRRGPAAQVLDAIVEETAAGRVVWSRTYEPAEDERDEAIATALAAKGVETERYAGRLLAEPGAVLTQGGTPYGVFSPFWRAMQAAIAPEKPLPKPKRLTPPSRWPKSDDLDGWALHPAGPDWSTGFEDWSPGEAGAAAGLRRFLDQRLSGYPTDRDLPALDGSSQLSPHLAWGEIGPRQVYCAARARLASDGLEHQVDKFLSELAWRDFDYGLLAQQPKLEAQPFKPAAAVPDWRRSASDLEAWKRGATGYPIVDAGMRQLWRIGWMHNRVRLVTASFLVKHLLIDWREGERWFWDCLVDADPANNPANWQWVAGTGADAQPFFRIFNPVLQGKKFDPEGDYVRRWVPELKTLDRRYIHSPWLAPEAALAAAGVTLGKDYPRPVVDHAEARARALQALNDARQAKRDA